MKRLLILIAFTLTASAQYKSGSQTVLLDLPRTSPRAVVTQRIGLSDLTIVYHRPQAKGRTIFGDAVPYDRVWRAGANDNTTIELTDPTTIEGQTLPAGIYGVHMIPGRSEWTMIFSKNSTSWGSFSYDEKEDALRVKVKPVEAPFRETMTYEFTDLTPDTATLSLAWERVAVPLHVSVDTRSKTLATIRNQLRTLPGFKGEAWSDAALYAVDNEFDYPEALTWIDRAIQMDGENFANLDTRAQVLKGLKRDTEAEAVQKKALAIATPPELYSYGDRLIREKRLDDARTFFTKATTEHPDAWMEWLGLARAQAAQGDRASAKASLEQAMQRAPGPPQKRGMQRRLDKLQAGQSIE